MRTHTLTLTSVLKKILSATLILLLTAASGYSWFWDKPGQQAQGQMQAQAAAQEESRNPFEGKVFIRNGVPGYNAFSGQPPIFMLYMFNSESAVVIASQIDWLNSHRHTGTYTVKLDKKSIVFDLDNGEHNEYKFTFSANGKVLQLDSLSESIILYQIPTPVFCYQESSDFFTKRPDGDAGIAFQHQYIRDLIAQAKGESISAPVLAHSTPTPPTRPTWGAIWTVADGISNGSVTMKSANGLQTTLTISGPGTFTLKGNQGDQGGWPADGNLPFTQYSSTGNCTGVFNGTKTVGSDNFLLFAVNATHPAPTPTATPIPAPTAAPTPPTVTTASGNQYFTQDGLTSTPASRQADPPQAPNALATIGLLGEYSGTLKGDGNGHTGPMALAITLANVKKRAIFCLMKIEKEEPNTFMGTGPANGGDTFTIERTEGKGVITFVFVPTVDGLRGNWSMTSPNTPTITGTCSLTKTKED